MKLCYVLQSVLLLSCFNAVSTISAWILSSCIPGAADVLYLARVFEQPLSLGHCRFLLVPTLIWFMGGSFVMFSGAQSCFVTAPHVCVLVVLYECPPAVTRLTVYRRPQVDLKLTTRIRRFAGAVVLQHDEYAG